VLREEADVTQWVAPHRDSSRWRTEDLVTDGHYVIALAQSMPVFLRGHPAIYAELRIYISFGDIYHHSVAVTRPTTIMPPVPTQFVRRTLETRVDFDLDCDPISWIKPAGRFILKSAKPGARGIPNDLG
jgi:hypothetical protein